MKHGVFLVLPLSLLFATENAFAQFKDKNFLPRVDYQSHVQLMCGFYHEKTGLIESSPPIEEKQKKPEYQITEDSPGKITVSPTPSEESRTLSGFHLIAGGSIYNDCLDTHGDRYSVIISGLSLIATGFGGFVGGFYVYCPNLKKENLDKRIERKKRRRHNPSDHVNFRTIVGTISLPFSIGVIQGFSLNGLGRACFVSGNISGFDVSLTIGTMGIYSGTLKENGHTGLL